MAALIDERGPLEKKFFDLVVHPKEEKEGLKAASAVGKKQNLDKKPRPVQRSKPVALGKKRPDVKKEEPTQPLENLVVSSNPLHVQLTPNPSATVLLCRVEREVKDAERSVQNLKQLISESRNASESEVVESKDETDKMVSVPQVIELGLAGVFELIRETVTDHKNICCKALTALLNMLQGQKLEGMKNEPDQVLENLFQILLQLSRLPPEESEESSDDLSKTSLPGIGPVSNHVDVSKSIPSLASSCLLSLVFAWGNTGKILAVITSFIADCSSHKSPLHIKIPSSFVKLQQMVTAAVLKKDHLCLPYKVGINKSALLKSWKIRTEELDLQILSIQSDGSYIYCLLLDGQLLKVGSGYNGTVAGRIYKRRSVFDLQGCSKLSSNDPSQLFYADGSLFLVTSHRSIYSINSTNLKEKLVCNLSSLDGVWFSDGHGFCCMLKCTHEDAYKLNTYNLESGKLVLKQSTLRVEPTQKHLVTLGNSLGFSPYIENHGGHDEIVQVCVGKDFSISRNSSGAVFYAGRSELLGLGKARSRKVVTPEPLPLSSSAKISHISVAPDGGHAILISDAGVTFFVGTSRRGEDGEAVKNRKQPQAQKPKLMKSMFGKHAITACCNAGTSAIVTKDGKLYLFGKDSTQADSKTGLVSSLHNVHVKQVGLGKAHVVVLSNDGRIWTAGVNNKGQCGRQEGTTPMAQRIAEVEQERDVSMPEEKSMEEVQLGSSFSGDAPIAPICSPDKHKWRKDICMVCAVCCECTGYGPSCVNSSLAGRYPGRPCGCGVGPSGCSKCGCCKTCAGEADVNQDDKRKEKWTYSQLAADVDIPAGVEHPPPFLHKLTALYQHKKKLKPSPSARNAGKSNSAIQIGAETLTEASKLALLPLQLIKLDKNLAQPVKIVCGAHHTIVLLNDGLVYGFGQNTHGHLGLGDKLNRNTLTHIPLPEKIEEIAAGSHHSLFLSTSGVVYGCGNNDRSQLGERVSSLDGSTDVLTPTKILDFQLSDKGNSPKASWISASHTTTFIEYEEVLLSFAQLQTSQIFADNTFVGISYRPSAQSPDKESEKSLLLVDKHSGSCRLLNNEDSISLGENELACVDSSHNLLWKVNSDDLTVHSYILSGCNKEQIESLPTILPELAISLQPGALITRTQAGLNLLSCIDTLVTRCPTGLTVTSSDEKGAENAKSQKRKVKEPHTADEYNTVNRFKSHGGGWGYSVHSTEAIRFMCDTDILLGGIGVFGGRGEYSVIVSLFEEVGELDMQGEGEMLVETDRTPYECGFREKFHALFDEPVLISAGQWYTITAKISGPSSDCGSHGKESVTTSDDVKFSFRRSKRSNNGTDVSSGQIPELLYTLPTILTPVETTPPVPLSHIVPIQQVSKDFFMNFNETVFDALPYILEWSRTSLFMDVSKKSTRYEEQFDRVVTTTEQTASNVIKNLSYVFTSCLRLLRVAIAQSLTTSGKDQLDFSSSNLTAQFISLIEGILTDGELDAALEDSKVMPLNDQDLVVTSAVTMVTECHRIKLECMEMLHPSPPQKWNYLYQALENYNTGSAELRPRASRLLVAVLDALCQPSINLVQCLPLFPRTFSNLASIASAAQSPCVDSDIPGTTETPHLSQAAGFYEVANLLVEIACSPARILVSLEKQNNLPTIVSSLVNSHAFFSSFLLNPVQALVKSACNFLVTLMSDLAYKACDNAKNQQDEKNKSKQSIYQAHRFEKTASERTWNTGNGSPDAISFSVDVEGVHITGFGLFGGGKEKHKYELDLFQQTVSGVEKSHVRWETLDHVQGSFTSQDCGSDHITHIKLNKPVLVQKNQVYAVCLHNVGEQTYCGEQGQGSVKGDDGTNFFFSHCSQCINGSSVSRGQFPIILYQRTSRDEDLPMSPSDKWIGTATTPAKATLAYQRHALNILALVTESSIEIFNSVSSAIDDEEVGRDEGHAEVVEDGCKKPESGVFAGDHDDDDLNKMRDVARQVLSSELVTDLLPQLYSDIGVLVKRNAHCAVEVMDLIRDLLPPLINIQQLAQFDNVSLNEKTKHFTVTVESNHPYKPAAVNQKKVSFPACVKWMIVEFSHKCQTAQREDFLQLYLLDPNQKSTANVSEGVVTKISEMKSCHPVLKKMYQDKHWPQKAVLLPGREMIFSLETASDYTNNRDQKPNLFYGYHCTVTGYVNLTFPNKCDELVNKLINTAGLCAVNLMTVHDQLWDEDVEPSLSNTLDDKIEHLKVIESSAAVTLEQHSSLFLPGLHLNNFPGPSEALMGDLPINDGSKEKKFLLDFVSATPDTSGGRLARWLQPDSYVDPKHCLLQLNVKTLFHTLPTSVTIITRDQYGHPVHVPTLKVELSAKPQPSTHYLPPDVAANFDISPSDPAPAFDVQYEATKHRDSRYHSISMMRAYKKYSFEELRLAYPLKRTLKTENILVASVGSGEYRATWIPTCATTYALQVTLDQQLKGPRQIVEVSESPHGCTDRPKPNRSSLTKTSRRFLKFATKNSRGLRIRSNPTLQSPQSGLLEYGDIIEYVEEIRNSDGSWVKLSETSSRKFCKEPLFPEAWCISYHKHNGRTFLVPVEISDITPTEVDGREKPTSSEQNLEVSSKSSEESPSSSKFNKSPFTKEVGGKSPVFSSPFAIKPPTKDEVDWLEKIPGSYALVKCGSSGHNIRHKPSLKATPVGKLLPRSTFTAVSVVRNKSGTWISLHESDASKYCDESYDPRYAWALAVSSDGVLYIQSTEGNQIRRKSKITSSPTVNMNNLVPQKPLMANTSAAIRGAMLAKMSNPFNNAPPGGQDSEVVDLLVATSSAVEKKEVKAKTEMSHIKNFVTNEVNIAVEKVKGHHRSSSDSRVVSKRGSASHLHAGKSNRRESSPRGRSRHQPSNSRSSTSTRSHSSPSSRRTTRRSTSLLASSSIADKKQISDVGMKAEEKSSKSRRRSKDIDEYTNGSLLKYTSPKKKQSHPKSSALLESTPPADKVIRGGQKKLADILTNHVTATPTEAANHAMPSIVDDIPFIDDVVDMEGNILSPNKPSCDLDVSEVVAHDEAKTPTPTQNKKFPSTPNVNENSKNFPKSVQKKMQNAEIRVRTNSAKALSPLVAESSRSVFAAFLWHEGITHDAMACASYLKFNQTHRCQVMEFIKQSFMGNDENTTQTPGFDEDCKEKQPPDTLVYLALFWDKLSDTVTKIAIRNQNLPPPTPVNHNLNSSKISPPVVKPSKKQSRETPANDVQDPGMMIKVPPLKRKAYQRHYIPQLAQARRNMQGQMLVPPYLPPPAGDLAVDHFKDTMCDLCDKVHPYPVTYHMRQAHPGCSKYAGGLGYNSSGHYCGGWAGECGDGGIGGSTWYLLCVDCRGKYMASKTSAANSSKKEQVKSVGDWKKQFHRSLLQPANAHQIMKNNSMFLLDLVSSATTHLDLHKNKVVDPLDKWKEEGIAGKSASWDNSDLLPFSKFSHCPFPAIPCSYLLKIGEAKPSPSSSQQVNKFRSEYRNRSHSSQVTPSSDHFKNILQRLSTTPEATPLKSETKNFYRRSRLMRSVSTGSQPSDRKSKRNNNEDTNCTGSHLLHHPSPSMMKLMKLCENNNVASEVVSQSSVLAFVMQRHDLKSLHLTLQMTLRRAALRVYVLQAMTWLLRTVLTENCIHDILWYFVCALAESNGNDNKNEAKVVEPGNESADEDVEETKALCQHPVKHMALAGLDSMKPLVEAFHGFLQTVSNIMMHLPANSPVQLMAIRCWSLRVLPSDHHFLHESQVFSHISQLLSKVDTKVNNTDVTPIKKKLVKVKPKSSSYVPVDAVIGEFPKVSTSQDLTNRIHIKTSSHAAIASSLTDGSTETFWESGDEDKNKPKSITIDVACDKDGHRRNATDLVVEDVYLHIDNTRDVQKKVMSVSFWIMLDDDDWRKMNVKELNAQFAGWVQFSTPHDSTKFKFELRGPDNGLRVRQIKVLGFTQAEGPKLLPQISAKLLQARKCEVELLKVFKLLTAEVFGQLLSEETSTAKNSASTPTASEMPTEDVKPLKDDVMIPSSSATPASPRDVDPNLREHMVGILFSRSKLTTLQKKVFEHTVQAIHNEASHIKKTWEQALDSQPQAQVSKSMEMDSYCFELLSMILALTGSDVGRHYVAQQSALIQDMISLLHTASPRIQRQVTLLLRRILSEVTPGRMASILDARVPTQDKLTESMSEASSCSSLSESLDKTEPRFSVLDPLLTCISKSLSVQVKRAAKSETPGGEGDAASTLKSGKRTQSVTMSSVFAQRRGDDCMWWLHGNMEDKSIVEAVMKMLIDMTENQISPQWSAATKCAVSESLLALTRLSDAERESEACLNNPILWRALAALCVISQDHVERLSSARSSHNKNKTLLKPNGGFIFDSNKVLVELECKTYKTVFEESIQLPKITQENPFPMIHTSPFSVGGFAWQIRIFPDGPDEDNKGNVALFLHCTTSNHLAKVKARFLIEGQQSPAVYEHTFPPNSISEMPSGVAFPNKGDFMNSLKGNKLKVGIEFLTVIEVNEVHVTLSEPNMYPTVCVTPFEDINGCPWVLKTLQATKLKLKMDQNEKTTSGLMEFYHRHIMWNATLVSPGSEDVSLNVPLNTKGPLIGYFGENWSDADVIKSDLAVEDLAVTDNPYRTDVDDGYDRYSYVSIHVEIVSNHLLYKTPAPSPTGDRERKLLYNARKDRAHIHSKYQELLRQKASLENKCDNLTRERTRLIKTDEGSEADSYIPIVPDFSKFLFDVLSDLALCGTTKGKIVEGRTGRPYRSAQQPSDTERLNQFASYRDNFSLLVTDARPNPAELAATYQEVENFKSVLMEFIQAKTALRITDIIMTGSLGTNTTCSNRWDVDFVMLSTDLPRNGHSVWMPSFVVALTKMLEEGGIDGKLPDVSNFTHTMYSVQFDFRNKVEVDFYPAYDWQNEEGYDALYDELLRQRTSENLSWFCPAAAERQKIFIEEQPDQVKDLMKVVKHWRNASDWSEKRWRPSSYLLCLLLIRAYENACHVIEGSLPSNRTVLKCFVKLVLSTGNARPAPMRISWGRFYDPKDYNIEYSSSSNTECPPIVQDPANPANNVAERPVSWLPFRQMLESWAHALGMMEEGTLLPIESLTCENHDDGVTQAIIQCNECGNLCSECDRYLHLHRRTRSHQRQIFKEEEEAIRVDLHEGCGRIKLFWFKALADSNTLKAMVEFKNRSTGQMQLVTSDACRFCGSACDNAQLVMNNVCNDPTCQNYAATVCTKTHSCGHLCGGVKDEETCLSCLHSSCNPGLNQDADDMCMICFTDALSAAPAIQLKCGHIFHIHCCQTQLQKQWAGPRITFGFLLCSICKNEIYHEALESYLKPLRELMQEVKRKALQRLEYEGLKECESITTVGGKFYKDPTGFALNKYAYYMCCKCNKAYYGGEVRCDAEADGDLFDPQELICGACSDISCAQICPKHGTDFLEYKCRYCCSVAVYFCFGTTHFCQPCHDDFQRITGLPKSELPHCPAGQKARQLEGTECPLHVQHPPTGEEFALGCGVCRNAHTF